MSDHHSVGDYYKMSNNAESNVKHDSSVAILLGFTSLVIIIVLAVIIGMNFGRPKDALPDFRHVKIEHLTNTKGDTVAIKETVISTYLKEKVDR